MNKNMPGVIAKKVLELIKDKSSPKVTVFGVSYKENTGDTRESPALPIIKELKAKGIEVAIYDPLAENFKYGSSDLEESLRNSDMIVLLAGHKQYCDLDLKYIGKLMRTKNIFDTRDFFDKKEVAGYGFKHFSV
jgi:UDP-N-acetyl-D-mannosaminuronic acid dehydrogenase